MPDRLTRYLESATELGAPQGMILSDEALNSYLEDSGVGREVRSLIAAISDEESRKRVDHEIRRRIVTGRIPDSVAQAIGEVVDVLGLHRTDMAVHEVPLAAVLYTDAHVPEQAVLNITGRKQLADALRRLWSGIFTSPYPQGAVSAAVCVFRMPPIEKTASVLAGDEFTVEAVKGWGRLVGADEQADTYRVGKDLVVLDRQVVRQDLMTRRNPRSGDMVQTAPSDPGAQKLTEDQIRMCARDARRTGESSCVIGLGKDKRWLLSFPADSEPVGMARQSPVVEPVVEDHSVQEPVESAVEESQEAEIEIVELDSPVEESEDDILPPPPEVIGEEPADRDEDDSSGAALQQTQQFASSTVLSAMKTIELVMREWLYDDGPEDFSALVHHVASKRALPHKQRLLELASVREKALYEEVSPEQVLFALDTMKRFVDDF